MEWDSCHRNLNVLNMLLHFIVDLSLLESTVDEVLLADNSGLDVLPEDRRQVFLNEALSLASV